MRPGRHFRVTFPQSQCPQSEIAPPDPYRLVRHPLYVGWFWPARSYWPTPWKSRSNQLKHWWSEPRPRRRGSVACAEEGA